MTNELYTRHAKGFITAFNREATDLEIARFTEEEKAEYISLVLEPKHEARLAEFRSKFNALVKEYEDAFEIKVLDESCEGKVASVTTAAKKYKAAQRYTLVHDLETRYALKGENLDDDYDEEDED